MYNDCYSKFGSQGKGIVIFPKCASDNGGRDWEIDLVCFDQFKKRERNRMECNRMGWDGRKLQSKIENRMCLIEVTLFHVTLI